MRRYVRVEREGNAGGSDRPQLAVQPIKTSENNSHII